MANSADPDQLASELNLHCLQRQGISGFSRTRVTLSNTDYQTVVILRRYGQIQQTTNWYFSHFSQKILRHDISCNLTPTETIFLKSQNLFFSRKGGNLHEMSNLIFTKKGYNFHKMSNHSFHRQGDNLHEMSNPIFMQTKQGFPQKFIWGDIMSLLTHILGDIWVISGVNCLNVYMNILQILRDTNVSIRWRFWGHQSQIGAKSCLFFF